MNENSLLIAATLANESAATSGPRTPVALLDELGACCEAVAYCKTKPDLETAWRDCERGDWLLWFAGKRGVKRQTLVWIDCQCARLALPHAKSPAVEACIVTAEKWTRGEATIEQVKEARAAAYAAYAAAAAYAAYAADAAYAAACAAACAADAAAYAAYAADAAYAARTKTLRRCAEIVREHIPNLP